MVSSNNSASEDPAGNRTTYNEKVTKDDILYQIVFVHNTILCSDYKFHGQMSKVINICKCQEIIVFLISCNPLQLDLAYVTHRLTWLPIGSIDNSNTGDLELAYLWGFLLQQYNP